MTHLEKFPIARQNLTNQKNLGRSSVAVWMVTLQLRQSVRLTAGITWRVGEDMATPIPGPGFFRLRRFGPGTEVRRSLNSGPAPRLRTGSILTHPLAHVPVNQVYSARRAGGVKNILEYS